MGFMVWAIRVFKILSFIFFLPIFFFRKMGIFMYFVILDLRLGLCCVFSKPYHWCLYKADEFLIFQGVQFVWGVVIPLFVLCWRTFLAMRPLSVLYRAFAKAFRFFFFWFFYRKYFYFFVCVVLELNWYWLIWVLLFFVVFVCFFAVVPLFFWEYENSIDLYHMYDIETDTLLNFIVLVYLCFLPLFMCLTAVILFFLFGFFLISADIGTIFIWSCKLFWKFLVFSTWCFFRLLGFELRKLEIDVVYIFLLSVFHCLFFYIFLADIYLFADDIVSTYEFRGSISHTQKDLIKNSYLGVIGSYAVVILYYMRVCHVWGAYFDTRVFRVFLLVCFAWWSIPTKYWFSFLAPV